MFTWIKEIDGKWYAFGEYGDGQVCAIGRDRPESGVDLAGCCDSGIKYVATPSLNKTAARKKAQRAGKYQGVW